VGELNAALAVLEDGNGFSATAAAGGGSADVPVGSLLPRADEDVGVPNMRHSRRDGQRRRVRSAEGKRDIY